MRWSLLTLLLCLLCIGRATASGQTCPKSTPLQEILATPNRFKGQTVCVQGFLTFAFEFGKYLTSVDLDISQADADMHLWNSVAVSPSKAMMRNWKILNRRSVQMLGRIEIGQVADRMQPTISITKPRDISIQSAQIAPAQIEIDSSRMLMIPGQFVPLPALLRNPGQFSGAMVTVRGLLAPDRRSLSLAAVDAPPGGPNLELAEACSLDAKMPDLYVQVSGKVEVLPAGEVRLNSPGPCYLLFR